MRVKEIQDKFREIRKAIEEKTFWKEREIELDNLNREIQELKLPILVDSYLVRNPTLLEELEEELGSLKNDLQNLRES